MRKLLGAATLRDAVSLGTNSKLPLLLNWGQFILNGLGNGSVIVILLIVSYWTRFLTGYLLIHALRACVTLIIHCIFRG